MSGHNKWSQIKHKKSTDDAKKSKLFSMLVKIITVESRKAGGDLKAPGLKAVIDRAKTANMPAINIDRAVTKGQSNDSANLEEVTYEAYGPGGVAIIIEGVTDNKNRTTAEIKHILINNQSSLQVPGSALWVFSKTNDVWLAKTNLAFSPTETMEIKNLVAELGNHEDVRNIYTNINLKL